MNYVVTMLTETYETIQEALELVQPNQRVVHVPLGDDRAWEFAIVDDTEPVYELLREALVHDMEVCNVIVSYDVNGEPLVNTQYRNAMSIIQGAQQS